MINRYGSNASPCSRPATMTKSSVSPSGERTFTFMFLYSIIMQLRSICSIFPLCMESNALEKWTNYIVASRVFELTSSRILWWRGLISLKAISFLPKCFLNFLREREDASLCPSVYCVLVIYNITVSGQYVAKFPGFPYFWGYFIKPYCFPIFNFSSYWVKFFLCKLS